MTSFFSLAQRAILAHAKWCRKSYGLGLISPSRLSPAASHIFLKLNGIDDADMPPFRVFIVLSSIEISIRISMRSERQSEMVMKVHPTSICSLLRCSRTSPTSWRNMRILPSRTALRSGLMNSAPSPSTRCFRRLSSCGG